MAKFPRRNREIRKRRPRGTGTIFYSKAYRCWVGRVPVGRANGRTLYREVRAATQGELLPKLSRLEPPGPTTTVAEWAERWLAGLRVRESTAQNYRALMANYVIPAWGHLRLSDVTPHHIERALLDWSAKQSPNTLRVTLRFVRSMFLGARKARIIDHSPAESVRPPKARKVIVQVFTPEELAAIIAEGGIWALLASTGCRAGEACALDVSDFDPIRGKVSITKNYDLRAGIRRPKSENSIRDIAVPQSAFPALLAARGKRVRGPLFRNSLGNRWAPTALIKSWRTLLARLGLPFRRMHILRHSVGSVLAGTGVPIADVAAYLGDSPEMILRTYVKPVGADVAGAMELALSPRAKAGTAG